MIYLLLDIEIRIERERERQFFFPYTSLYSPNGFFFLYRSSVDYSLSITYFLTFSTVYLSIPSYTVFYDMPLLHNIRLGIYHNIYMRYRTRRSILQGSSSRHTDFRCIVLVHCIVEVNDNTCTSRGSRGIAFLLIHFKFI